MDTPKNKSVKESSFTLTPIPSNANLPVEYMHQGAVPSPYIRSALFGVVKKGTERFVTEKTICSQGDYKIAYTGEELTQTDLTIWLVVKKNCLGHGTSRVELKTLEILKQLNRSRGQADKKWLRKKITKLCSSVITLTHKAQGTTANLIRELSWVDDFDTFTVCLDERILQLFSDTPYMLVDLPMRAGLKSDLAKWLYTYWSSHREIYDVYDYTLRELCGSEMTDKNDFRKALRGALKELEKIMFISEFEINRQGKITVSRKKRIYH